MTSSVADASQRLHRFSYATVSLPDLTPDVAIRELASAGYRGIEWKVGEAPNAGASTANRFLAHNRCTLDTATTDAAALRARCEDAGVTTVGIAPYVQVGDVDGLRRVVDFAVRLGAPQIRFQAPRPAWSGRGTTIADLQGQTKAFVEAASPIISDADVRLVLEIHQDTIAASALRAHQLLEGFPTDLIGVIYDIGNLVREGFEQHAIALDLLAARLHHVHLKNVGARRTPAGGPGWEYTWSPLDDGFVDVPAVLDLLATRGYIGWISLEDLSVERDPLETLRHNANVLAQLPSVVWPRSGAHS